MTRSRRATALVLVVASFAATASTAGASAYAKPRHGGSVTFALEAESNGGFCVPSATLAASGIQVVTAIYDTLVTLNSDGEYVPYLAKSIEPNADYTQWTITLRDGVKFHDGTAFDAAALKLNLDTYRGANPKISAPLNTFVFQDIASVEISGPLSVVVTTKRPWPAFPATLWGTGRFGMAAPAQLNDAATCATHPIGTGPFRFEEWRPNDSLTVGRNPDYWRKGLPYLDEIVFRPQPEAQQRENGLLAGDFELSQHGGALQIIDLSKKAKNGEVSLVESDRGAEVGYGMLNVSKPPFDDIIARQAVAYAGDARELNDIRNKGLFRLASGPFPPDSPAYLKSTGLPGHNLKKARALAREYEQKHGQPIAYEYLTGTDPELLALAQLVKEQEGKAGIEITIHQVDQATLISLAIAGRFQQLAWRNHPGGDPDTQYVWWHSGSPVNFGRINDPVIDRLLDEGRVETDAKKRVKIYQQLNRRFAKELYDLWVWYQGWAIASQTDVKGVAGPPLPDHQGRPFALFAGVIPVVGLYRAK